MRATAPIALAIASAALVLAPGCRSADGVPRVDQVIDGDTVEIRFGDRVEVVRLVGVDTPETVHPDRPVECFGPEASAALAALLPPGTEVTLALDVEARDRFGRLLAYLTRRSDDLDVNAYLLAAGFARPLAVEPNTALASSFSALAATAQTSRLGLWGACPDEAGS